MIFLHFIVGHRPPSRRGARELITKPRPLAVIRNRRLNSVALLVQLRSVQFSTCDRSRPLVHLHRPLPCHTTIVVSVCYHTIPPCLLSSSTFPGASMHFGSTFLSRLRMMLVGIWLGLYWALFSFFDHYIQSSVRYGPVVQVRSRGPPFRIPSANIESGLACGARVEPLTPQ